MPFCLNPTMNPNPNLSKIFWIHGNLIYSAYYIHFTPTVWVRNALIGPIRWHIERVVFWELSFSTLLYDSSIADGNHIWLILYNILYIYLTLNCENLSQMKLSFDQFKLIRRSGSALKVIVCVGKDMADHCTDFWNET